MPWRKSQKRFRGQSLVEFALVSPIFLLMLFGTIEMGRLMWVNHELTNATREGARWAAVRGEMSGENITVDNVRTVILDRSTALEGGSLTVAWNWSANREPGSTVTIMTTYQYQPIIGMIVPIIGTVTMERQSTMTVHY